MPKISPRPAITGHPLYQASMDAQHLAYQLMRQVPPDHRTEAALLVKSCVHATAYATAALEDERADRAESTRLMAACASEALARLAPIAHLAQDARDAETLQKKLEEMVQAAA